MLKFILVIVASYALLVAVVYFMQDRMLYLPNVAGRALTMTPKDAGMDFEEVSIDTADGGSRRRHPDRWLTGRPAEVLV